jgi:hypothetical protein
LTIPVDKPEQEVKGLAKASPNFQEVEPVENEPTEDDQKKAIAENQEEKVEDKKDESKTEENKEEG